MTDESHNTPKLSERFSDLFGVDVNEAELSSDHFSDSIYLEESRKLNLNKLLHLAPYSEVLLLLGGLGVGKTTLLNAFVARSATTWKTIQITASALMTPLDFLRAIAQGFELEVDESTSVDDLQWQLERFVQALGRTGRRAIVVIDDAHMLTDDVLRQAETFLRAGSAEHALSLLLSMRQDYESKLSQFTLLHENLAYTLKLQPLTKKELQGYLRLKLANRGIAFDQVFTAEVLYELMQASGGLPESINELVQEVLASRTPSRKALPANKGPALKYVVIAAALLVVALVLIFQDSINRVFEAQPAADGLVDESLEPLVMVDEVIVEELAPALVLGDDNSIPKEVALPPEIVEQVAAPVLEKVPVEEEPVDPEPVPLAIPIEQIEQLVEAQVAAAPQQAEMVIEELAVEQEAEAQEIAAAESAPVEVEVEAVVVAEVPEEVVKPIDPELEWIRAQPANNYTMQLMALVDHDKVLRFVAKHGIQEDSATYIKSRKGKELMVLVYGSYANRNDAVAASKQVPKNWYVGQPWVRSFASVTSEIKP